MDALPLIAVSIGDPAGIGPEIALKLATEQSLREHCRLLIVGDITVLDFTAENLSVDLPPLCDENLAPASIFNLDNTKKKQFPPGPESGRAAGRYIETCARLCMDGKAEAMTTCPVDKNSLKAGGYDYPGHTEFLARLTGTDVYRMTFLSDSMKVVLNTTHLSLRDSIGMVTGDRIIEGLHLIAREYPILFGETPRIGVCGLNPHAGEGGLFGGEEREEIIPAIEKVRKEGISVDGPFAPDTFFHRLLDNDFDIALAMYHDQGLIPLKTLEFPGAVNFTMGLPIIRTSVDHGVAYDIAGKGAADHTSLLRAVLAAAEMAVGKSKSA